MIAENSDLVLQLGIVSYYRTGFTECTEIFPGIKTETGRISKRTNSSPVVFGSVSLGSVFHDKQAVPAREFRYRIHVCRLTKKMDRNDRLRSWRNSLFHHRRIHRVSALVHIDEHGSSPTIGDRLGGSHERVWHRDHLVTWSDA